MGTSELEAQLDSMHREEGEKGRELRRAQDTVRMLRAELQQERVVSEQYRVQMEVLEDQYRSAQQMLRHAPVDDERRRSTESARDRSSSRSTSRPASARVTKAWGESSSPSPSSFDNGAMGVPRLPSSARGFQSLAARTQVPVSDDSESSDDDDAESSDDVQETCRRKTRHPSNADMHRTG